MKFFLDMCKHLRTNKIAVYDQDVSQSEARKAWEDCLKICEVFVFHDLIFKADEVCTEKLDVELAAPFECFSIELTGDRALFTIGEELGDNFTICMALVVKEVGPGCYEYFQLLSPINRYEPFVLYLKNKDSIANIRNTNTAERILQLMDKSSQGIEKVSQIIKIGKGKQKKKGKINRVIHIKPKKIDYENNLIASRNIAWTHSWLVRGHWRKLPNENFLGKNRYGDYVIQGKTFVNPFQKGEGKLERKIRVFK